MYVGESKLHVGELKLYVRELKLYVGELKLYILLSITYIGEHNWILVKPFELM